jgi:putative toxin-antitoxin system antitoxin component (TIGR02293 family)
MAVQPTASQIVTALGGRQALGTRVGSIDELRSRVEHGLPHAVFEAVRLRYGIEPVFMRLAVGVPERTLMRRKREGRFRAIESDRLTRLARVAAFAEDVLGDAARAGRWLQKPNWALGGSVPLQHLVTELGGRQVEELLGRIAHGVHS